MKLNRKNKLLLAGFLFTLYLCYAFAFSKTITYFREYQEKKELSATAADNPELVKQLIQKEKQLDAYIESYGTAGANLTQNELLKRLSALSRKHDLNIIDFREPHSIDTKGIKTISYIFSLQGSFNSILTALNSLENNASFGVIKHISFVKKKDYKTNTYFLTADIILGKSEAAK